jgi:hypothetical protein
MNKKVLLLCGSPKDGKRSACAVIGERFLIQLRRKNFSAEMRSIGRLIKTEDGVEKLDALICRSDIIVFISPVYLDTVPSSVTRLMELSIRKKYFTGTQKILAAVSVCGYPESFHNDTALMVYKQFAHEAGLRWAGGIAIGQGPAYVYAQSIFRILGIYRKMDRAFDVAAQAFDEDTDIPEGAACITRRSIIPDRVYTFVAILIVRLLSAKCGAWNLCKRPYERSAS